MYLKAICVNLPELKEKTGDGVNLSGKIVQGNIAEE